MSILHPSMSRRERRDYVREARAHLTKENGKWPFVLRNVPRDEWPGGLPDTLIKVMRSRVFMMQCYQEADGVLRLSVHRTAITDSGDWVEGITWDDLQTLKREAGYADRHAVEVYPPDRDVVNVANIRHLWVLPEAPAFAWMKGKS